MQVKIQLKLLLVNKWRRKQKKSKIKNTTFSNCSRSSVFILMLSSKRRSATLDSKQTCTALWMLEGLAKQTAAKQFAIVYTNSTTTPPPLNQIENDLVWQLNFHCTLVLSSWTPPSWNNISFELPYREQQKNKLTRKKNRRNQK